MPVSGERSKLDERYKASQLRKNGISILGSNKKKFAPNLNAARKKIKDTIQVKVALNNVSDTTSSETEIMNTNDVPNMESPHISLANRFDALSEQNKDEDAKQRWLEATIEQNEKKRKMDFPELRQPQKKSQTNAKPIPGSSPGGSTSPAATSGINTQPNVQGSSTGGFNSPTATSRINQPNIPNRSPLGTTTATAAPKREKPPPISIYQQDPKVTVRLITDQLNIKDFYIKKFNEGKHSVFLANVSDHKKVKDLLTIARTSYFTYTPKSEKTQSFLLKGLHSGYEPEEIEYELKNLNIENLEFVKVSRFTTPKSKETKRVLPFLLVQISANSSAGKLHEIRHIAYQVVSWERLNKPDPLQCKNCQRYGHVASNCNMNYRCVKCAENHAPGECKITNEEGTVEKNNIYCVVCRNHGHPASYRGCPKYKEFKKKIQESIANNKEKKQKQNRLPSSFVNSNISFAQMTQQRNNNPLISYPINGIGNNQRNQPSLGSEAQIFNNVNIKEMFNNFQNNMMAMLQQQLQQQFQCIMQIVQKNSETIAHIMENVMPVMNQLRNNP